MIVRLQRVRSVARLDRPRAMWLREHHGGTLLLAAIMRNWSYEIWMVRG